MRRLTLIEQAAVWKADDVEDIHDTAVALIKHCAAVLVKAQAGQVSL